MKPSLFTPFAAALLWTALITGFVVGFNELDQHLPLGDRFVPELGELQAILRGMMLGALPVALVVTWRTARSELRAARWGVRISWGVSLLLLSTGLAAGALYADISTRTNWLFGPPPPYSSARSPDGTYTAYLSRDCFLGCSFTVHVRKGWEPVMHVAVNDTGLAAEPLPTLVWLADGGVSLARLPEHERFSPLR